MHPERLENILSHDFWKANMTTDIKVGYQSPHPRTTEQERLEGALITVILCRLYFIKYENIMWDIVESLAKGKKNILLSPHSLSHQFTEGGYRVGQA